MAGGIGRRWVSVLGPCLWLGMGCGPMVELETDSDSSGSEPTDSGSTSAPPVATTTGIDPDSSGTGAGTREVDIIFVVDNSGSMGEEQAKIAIGIGNLVAALDGAVPPVDYRIGVTTTDNGNPWCLGTEAEAGAFVSTSCRERSQDFILEAGAVLDMFEEACADVCAMEELGLPDPWIEVQGSEGTTNVPGGAVVDALRCMMPQGISGCGYEQPLESLHKAIRRSTTVGEAQNGFLRPDALLAVAIITDEVDCSYDVEHETIFLPDGNRVFWSSPESATPTSAVCWNAGVACTGTGTPYDQCYAQNYGVDGTPVGEGGEAVLQPISRYIEQLQEADAYVVAIDGIGLDGSVTYAEDPGFELDFGIAPGCISRSAQAVPPVRLREVVQAVTFGGAEFSVCNSGFEPFMNAFGEGILQRLE